MPQCKPHGGSAMVRFRAKLNGTRVLDWRQAWSTATVPTYSSRADDLRPRSEGIALSCAINRDR